MNILNTFEDRVSAIFDTTSQGFRAPFSFKRLAKQAVREMDKETFVVNGVDTAPALFTILVSPVDDVAIRPFYTKLTTEIRQLVEAQAEKKRAMFVGEPLVRFMVDPSLRSGRFSVFAENVDARTLKRLHAEEASYIDGIGGGQKRGSKRQAPSQGGSSGQQPPQRRRRPRPQEQQAPQQQPSQPSAAPVNGQAVGVDPIKVAPTVRRPRPQRGQQQQQQQMQPHTQGQSSVPAPRDPDASGFVSLPSGVSDVPMLATGAVVPLPAAGGTKFGEYTPQSRQRGRIGEQFSGLFGKRAMQVPDQQMDAPIIQPGPPVLDPEPDQDSGLTVIPEEPRADDGGALLRAAEESQQVGAPITPYESEKPEVSDPLSSVASRKHPSDGMAAPYDVGVTSLDERPHRSPVTGYESNFTPHCMLIDRQSGRTYTAAAPVATIGRERSVADIVMTDPNISRRHAQLEWDGNMWHIVDLNSTNGTLVNNVDVGDSILRDGDVVTLGLINLEFREVM